jgi:hypothetical protein
VIELNDVAAGDWRLEIQPVGAQGTTLECELIVDAETDAVSIQAPFGSNAVSVRLPEPAGRLTGTAYLTPIHGATSGVSMRYRSILTREGTAIFQNVPAGEYSVYVESQGHPIQWALGQMSVVDSEEPQEMELAFTEGGRTLRVRAVCSETGEPLVDWKASVSSYRSGRYFGSPVSSDGDDFVTIAGLPPIAARVLVTSGTHAPGNLRVDLSDDSVDEVMVEADPAGRLIVDVSNPEHGRSSSLMEGGISQALLVRSLDRAAGSIDSVASPDSAGE